MKEFMVSSGLVELAQVITAVGILIAVFQLNVSIKQRQNDFEMLYIQRLWVVFDRISELPECPDYEDKEVCKVLSQYLILTSDQIGLRRLGRIGRHTWTYWEKDIRNFCSSELIHEYLKTVDLKSYSELRILLASKSGYDPRIKALLNRFFFIS